MNEIPSETKGIYEKGGNIFGGEFVLRKEDVYPITLYEKFEIDKETMANRKSQEVLKAVKETKNKTTESATKIAKIK